MPVAVHDRSRWARESRQQVARPGDRGADAEVVHDDSQRPVLGGVAALPLRDLERPDTASAARRAQLVGTPPARPRGDATPPTRRRRARLQLVLPSSQATAGRRRTLVGARDPDGALVAPAVTPSGAQPATRPMPPVPMPPRHRAPQSMTRSTTGQRTCCASRSGRRRSAIRWCARSSARWSTSAAARRRRRDPDDPGVSQRAAAGQVAPRRARRCGGSATRGTPPAQFDGRRLRLPPWFILTFIPISSSLSSSLSPSRGIRRGRPGYGRLSTGQRQREPACARGGRSGGYGWKGARWARDRIPQCASADTQSACRAGRPGCSTASGCSRCWTAMRRSPGSSLRPERARARC